MTAAAIQTHTPEYNLTADAAINFEAASMSVTAGTAVYVGAPAVFIEGGMVYLG